MTVSPCLDMATLSIVALPVDGLELEFLNSLWGLGTEEE